MVPNNVRFDRFRLDPVDRLLTRDNVPVELNARYFDALALLVRDPGALVSKDRFLTEVWRGVPVTDEALTQCIKTLRRALGDRAGDPRFIETVPKHGYRFIAPVDPVGDERREQASIEEPRGATDLRKVLVLGGAGTIGGGFAGFAGGRFYGFGGATQPLAPAMGATSVLLVLVCLSILAGLIGGAGVGFGISAAELAPSRRWPWSALGGAVGGLVVGALAKLLGLDAFTLLLGHSPGAITGGVEGALLGGAVGLAAWRAQAHRLGRSMTIAGLAGGTAGVIITALGGRLMGGSLDLLANSLPNSRLRLDQFGSWFGEESFGPVTQAVTGGLEGLLFGACLVAAMLIARRGLDATR
jgi:DNA-binding winged helix-turn-helix (wHTH) protein